MPRRIFFSRDLSCGDPYIGGMPQAVLQTIQDDFAFLDDWEERYRYVIDLGADLDPYPEHLRDDAHKVQGCVSQVWLATDITDGPDPVLTFRGDSDAHIVRGLVAIILSLYSGRTARQVLATDADGVLKSLGLVEHLTPQRANGLRSMVRRIRNVAETALV